MRAHRICRFGGDRMDRRTADAWILRRSRMARGVSRGGITALSGALFNNLFRPPSKYLRLSLPRDQSKSTVPAQSAEAMLCCFSRRQTALCGIPHPGAGLCRRPRRECASSAVSWRAFGARFVGFAQRRPNAGRGPALTAPEPRRRQSPRARGRPFRAHRTAGVPADPRRSGADTAGDRSAPSRAPCPPRRGCPLL